MAFVDALPKDIICSHSKRFVYFVGALFFGVESIVTIMKPTNYTVTFLNRDWNLDEIWLSTNTILFLFMCKNIYTSIKNEDNFLMIYLPLQPVYIDKEAKGIIYDST